MFRKILIANRGEIALRILSACRELNVRTVAVYSEADRHALHVRFADEAICIGPPRSSESYLNIPQVISAAEIANVDAIHPGYGFLSENANFAEVCEASHITFIGPSPDAIRLMGEKDKAKEAMAAAGIPVIPGSAGVVPDEESAKEIARGIGYPVMIKAAEGGGGRGMRIVRSAKELIPAFRTARTEAEQAFGSPNVYMEKLIERPRHIEFQVLGDKHGNVVHLGERECSLQRRHQKVLEESPSVAVDASTRQKLGKQVVDALKKIGYSSAGTMEFLREDGGNLYFIEMNARIQVEHPVTEMVTGIDLVKSQIRVAAGEKLSSVLPPVEFRGHAIECRINAEDPETFTPSAGRVTAFRVPGGPGIRVDTACYADAVIPPYYDSLIAKLISYGHDRAEAIVRMQRALDGFVVEGVKTTIPLHKRILADPNFVAGKFDTHFLERMPALEAKAKAK
jgi:acetyl-CoA carboxylase biotin carboxylase subunit